MSQHDVVFSLQVEREKAALASSVQDLQEALAQSKVALDEHKVKVEQLSQRLEVLQVCSATSIPQSGTKSQEQNGNAEPENDDDLELDAKSAEVLEKRMRAANAELMQLRDELKEAGERCRALEERHLQEKERWRAEAQELADKIRQCIAASRHDQERIGQLELEIGATRRVATDSECHLSATQEELLAFSEELANLYHHVCMCNNLTPRRVTLDYYRDGARGGRRHHHGSFRKQRRSGETLGKGAHGIELDITTANGDASTNSGSGPSSPTLDFRDPTNVRNLVAVIRCQIKHLQVNMTRVCNEGSLSATHHCIFLAMPPPLGVCTTAAYTRPKPRAIQSVVVKVHDKMMVYYAQSHKPSSC